MTTDVTALRNFYASPLGEVAARLLCRRLERLWPTVKGETLLGLGYGDPFAKFWQDQARYFTAFAFGEKAATGSSSSQEFVDIDKKKPVNRLPFSDNAFDRIFVVHTLEHADDPDYFLHEVWRVLKGQGRALIVVPNRSGCWTRNDKTPFGTGRPYSAPQLKKLLSAHGFMVQRRAWGLYLPPRSGRVLLGLAGLWERCGEWFCPSLGGLLIIEVSKQLYAPLMKKAQLFTKQTLFPLTIPVQPAPAGRQDLC